MAHLPWRAARAERALTGAPATARGSRRAADAELAEAQPLPRNGYKVTLARNLIVATLQETCCREPPIEGRDKVTGPARYAYEYPADSVAYAYPVQSTVASGRIAALDAISALAMPGVLAVLSCGERPCWAGTPTPSWPCSQTREVGYRGQLVGRVVADTLETARARRAGRAHQLPAGRTTSRCARTTRACTRRTRSTRASRPTPTKGDVAAGLAAAAVSVDVTYTTPAMHNNPMEPHAAIAVWDPDGP